jgi:hypothetical protein
VPVALVRLDVPAGAVETVLGPDVVDISSWCWPLVPEPVDPWAYVEHWCDKLQLQAPRWTVTAEGRWPDTDLVVVLGHRSLPGVRLRRRFPLYDELGRQAPPEYVVIHIEEELATAGPPGVPRGATLWDF